MDLIKVNVPKINEHLLIEGKKFKVKDIKALTFEEYIRMYFNPQPNTTGDKILITQNPFCPRILYAIYVNNK